MHTKPVDHMQKNSRLMRLPAASRSLVTGLIAAASTALILSSTWAPAQEVKVGVQLPYTGVGAENAQQIDRGLDLYLKLTPRQGQAIHDQADQTRRQRSRRRQCACRGAGAADPGQCRYPHRLVRFAERDRQRAAGQRRKEARGDPERRRSAHPEPFALLCPRVVQQLARWILHGRGRR